MLEELGGQLLGPRARSALMLELAGCICAAVGADSVTLYLAESGAEITRLSSEGDRAEIQQGPQ